MTELNKTRRGPKAGPALVCGNCIPPQPDEELWIPSYYLQLARSLNLYRFGHPEIATRITFTVDYGGADVLWKLCRMVVAGQRFAPGDRVQLALGVWKERYTVAFYPHTTAYGDCLLAVVEELDESIHTDAIHFYSILSELCASSATGTIAGATPAASV